MVAFFVQTFNVREVSRRAGEQWRTMTPGDRAPFEALANESRAMFEKNKTLAANERSESYYKE